MGSGASVVKDTSSLSSEEKSQIIKKLTENFDSDIKGSHDLSDEDTVKLFHRIRESLSPTFSSISESPYEEFLLDNQNKEKVESNEEPITSYTKNSEGEQIQLLSSSSAPILLSQSQNESEHAHEGNVSIQDIEKDLEKEVLAPHTPRAVDPTEADLLEENDEMAKLMEEAKLSMSILTLESKKFSEDATLSTLDNKHFSDDDFHQYAGSPKEGTFRYRRLTFASQGKETQDFDPSQEKGTENSTSKKSDEVIEGEGERDTQITPSTSTRSSPLFGLVSKRTALYICPEIEEGPDEVPFPPQALGFFSRHGIEPSFMDSGNVMAKINQDRGCVVFPFNSSEEEALFCVFDGHGAGGEYVSAYTMSEIISRLENHPKLARDPSKALKEVFVDVDFSMADGISEGTKSFSPLICGTTAVVVYLKGTDMYIANAGDSKAVIYAFGEEQGQPTLVSKPLTTDHKPDDPIERARIENYGGYVSEPPAPGLSARVWLDPHHRQVGLAMSRSIGDHSVKHIGVIPEPDVRKHEVESGDEYLVLASDGLWEFLDVDQVGSMIQAFERSHQGEGELASDMAEYLIDEATKKWAEEEGDYRDDITVIVMKGLPPYFPTNATG